MRVTFVAEAYENLGIEYLSSCLKAKGHQVTLVYDPKLFNDAFCNIPALYGKLFSREDFIKKILDSRPDLIAFSSMSENYLWNLDMARTIKRIKDIPIIFGGIHPTSVPDRVIGEDCVDLLCAGEAEEAFPELADRFDKTGEISAEGIRNLMAKENGSMIINPMGHLTQDLDNLPFPDKFIFINEAPHMAKRYFIMTSRGCPYNCTFCYNSTIRDKKSFIRRRSVENVLEELRWAKATGIDYSYVMFGDDTFVQDKKWLFNFLEGYRRDIRKPFVCASHPRAIDEEALRALKSSRCTDIEIGIQTINPKIRREVLGRHESNEDIFRAMELIKRHKIRLIIDHIGGIPGETLEDYEKAALTYKKYNPNFTAFFWLSYYPKTPILKTALNQGLLSEKDQEQIEQGQGLDGKGNYGVVVEKYLGFELVFALIPVVPAFLLRIIVKNKYYNFFKKRSATLMVFLPRLIRSVIDMNFRPFFRHINRYMDLIYYIKRS